MKKTVGILALTLIIVLITSFTVCSQDIGIRHLDYAKKLQVLGILQGSEKGFELEKELTRLEGSVMLVRLLGKEEYAKENNLTHQFTDVPAWADDYVGYLYENGLTKGISQTTFGSSDHMTAQQYVTFVLRVLGYDDSIGDFTWDESINKAGEIGLLNAEEIDLLENKGRFLRDDMVNISFKTLNTRIKNSEKTLLEKLITQNAISLEVAVASGIERIGDKMVTKYKDDEKYFGDLEDGKRDGTGVYVYSNGDVYNGEWKDDNRCGSGTMVYSNGDRYTGEWKNDSMNGIGVYQYANGDRYEGGWKDGLMDGEGIITFSDGRTYKSKWRSGDDTGFQLLSTWPRDGQKNVEILSSLLSLIFSVDMKPCEDLSNISLVSDTGHDVKFKYTFLADNDKSEFYIFLNELLESNTKYTLTIKENTLESASGIKYAKPIIVNFTTSEGKWFKKEDTEFQLLTSWPRDGQKGVQLDSSRINLTFSIDMKPCEDLKNLSLISDSGHNVNIRNTFIPSEIKSNLQIFLNELLESNTKYTLTIKENTLESTSGIKYSKPIIISFTTGDGDWAEREANGIQLLTTRPLDKQKNAVLHPNSISLIFSTNMKPCTDLASISLVSDSGHNVKIKHVLGGKGFRTNIEIVLNELLERSTTYTLTIKENTLESENGIKYNKPIVITFTTGDQQ